MVATEILFTYHKYVVFGINTFEYADVFDFLTAPFSDLKIVLLTIGSLAFVFILFKYDSLYKKKNLKADSRELGGEQEKLV